MLSGNCQERELHDRDAPYVVPAMVTLYPDVLVLCPVVTCMTLILTLPLSCNRILIDLSSGETFSGKNHCHMLGSAVMHAALSPAGRLLYLNSC
jgi:hypothetical protein